MNPGDELPVLQVTPDRYVSVRYAGASGDFNPIHLDDEFAREVGLPGRILHGLWTMAQIARAHTDAAGGEGYNQELSERRADSIKRYLMDKYGIGAADLVTVGYGKSKLKDPSQPMAEVNRRVQVVNMENQNTASK